MTKISGIYIIFSITKPHHFYIGSSGDITKRLVGHKSDLNKNRHHSPKLQHHVNKYGINDLIFTILLTCDKDILIDKEQFCIDIFKPYFNMVDIAKYVIREKETPIAERIRRSKQSLELWKNPEFRKNQQQKSSMRWMGPKNPNFGKKQPKSVTEKISKSLKKYFATKEGKEKTERVNNLNKGNQYAKGHICSEEARMKMSEKARKRSRKQKNNAA